MMVAKLLSSQGVLCLAAALKPPSRRKRCQATIAGALPGTKRVQALMLHVYHTPYALELPISIVFFIIATPLQRSRSYSLFFLFNAVIHDKLSTIYLYSGTLHATLAPPVFFWLCTYILVAYSFCIFFFFLLLSFIISPPPPLFTLISMTCIELCYKPGLFTFFF